MELDGGRLCLVYAVVNEWVHVRSGAGQCTLVSAMRRNGTQTQVVLRCVRRKIADGRITGKSVSKVRINSSSLETGTTLDRLEVKRLEWSPDDGRGGAGAVAVTSHGVTSGAYFDLRHNSARRARAGDGSRAAKGTSLTTSILC